MQFSDIHLEEYTEDFFLRRVVRAANALAPDLLLITGDFISRGPLPISVALRASERCAQLLGGLTCKKRYGIFGNHDAIVGPSIIRGHLESWGLPILVDEHLRIDHGGAYLYLVGLNDAWFNPSLTDAMPRDPDAPVILMVHEPDLAHWIVGQPEGKDVDLILSGHTHGGQIRIPGLRPLALPPNGRLFPEGHYVLGSTQLYVNRGIGTVGIPLRLNCPPEITEITLRHAESAA